MEITKNNKTGNTVEAQFKVNSEEFEQALDKAYHRQKNNIAIPGFRKGKASRKMIENQYGENVFYEEAVNGLYKKIISDVIEELKIDVVDVPDTEVVSVGKEEGVEFKATFTVKPEVSIKGYLGLEVEESVQEINEDDIAGKLKEMQLRGARIIDVEDRAAEMGDTVVFDFKGFCEGKAFEGGEAANFSLELGSGRFIPGFEPQIAGKNIGEDFDVNVTFPEEYQAKELAGKEAVFECKINSIKGRELTELDDEFAKDVSEFDTLDELKADIKKKLEEAAEKRADEHFEGELSEKLIELVEADIPPVMYENRIDDMVRDWEYKNKQQGMSVQTYLQYSNSTMEQFREMFREMAEKQVKMRLALEKISELETIEVEAEKIEAEYEKLSGFYRMSVDKVKELIEPEALARDLKTEKAMEIVKENAKKIKGDK
ncbi:MAG: trigger factor [Oscillospiraceae bacterium]|jgi:trigger factor|nr:trigger factor [Oscillospiraceae bacterium]